jgi:NAD(P)-dependent dehydrogenase (short-subunit alcohol dehydrogenase family)
MAQLTWLVTGCSSGFGEAFVHEILKRGDKVIATSRGASSRLLNLQEAGAAILDPDITSPEPEIFAKLEQAIEIYGEIDVLVNNAGFFKWGLIEESR